MPNDPEGWPGQRQSDMEGWNFRKYHVGLDEGATNTNPITAENVLIGAGPARLAQIEENFRDQVFPIGMMRSANVGQQRMVQQVREIGSRRSYIVSSVTSGNLSMNRVMYSHASLLRVLTIANNDSENLDNPAGRPQGPEFDDSQESVAELTANREYYINMQAEIFDRPLGILFYMLDQRNQPYGAFYCEETMIRNHNMAIQSGSVQMAEQVNAVFDRAMPVAIQTSG